MAVGFSGLLVIHEAIDNHVLTSLMGLSGIFGNASFSIDIKSSSEISSSRVGVWSIKFMEFNYILYSSGTS